MSEKLPQSELDPKLIGKVALSEVPIEWWWTEGSTYDLPTYGAEMLGPEF